MISFAIFGVSDQTRTVVGCDVSRVYNTRAFWLVFAEQLLPNDPFGHIVACAGETGVAVENPM